MIDRNASKRLAAIALCAICMSANAIAAGGTDGEGFAPQTLCVKERVSKRVGAPGKRPVGAHRNRNRHRIVAATDGDCPSGAVRYVVQTGARATQARRNADQEAGE